ncbi:MAG: GtrA family protein [Gammaproteobacteria bacterium]
MLKPERIVPLFSKFLLAGALATLLQYSLLISMVQLLNTDPVLASVLAYSLSAVVNYHLNYRYTFRSRQAHRTAFSRFMIVAGIGLCLNAAVMHLGIRVLGWHYLLTQVLSTGLVLLWNFTANALWSFRHPADRGHDGA